MWSQHEVATNETPPDGTPKEEVKAQVYLLRTKSEAEALELILIVAKHTPAKKEE